MSKAKSSIPQAISVLVVGLALTISVIYSLIILLYSWTIEDNIFNRQVQAESAYIQQQFTSNGEVIMPRAGFMSLHKNWQDMPAFIVEGYQENHNKIEYSDEKTTYHIKVMNLGGTEYILMADVNGFEVSKDYLPNLLLWLLLLAFISSFVVSFVVYAIAKRLLKPMKQLAEQVQNLPANQVGKGFAQQYPNNELRALAAAIEQSFSELKQALQREVNFTRDVSHEFRTPICVLKNALDKNKQSQTITDLDFAQIYKASIELEQITNTLLALARKESEQLQALNMAELIEDSVLNHFELNNSAKGQALTLNLTLAEDVIVNANKNLVSILLNNIWSNIVEYSTEADVVVSLSTKQIQFINYSELHIPDHAIQAGVKGGSSRGIGQGLNLIERICQANHWQMHAEYKQTKFSLTIVF